MPAGIITVAKAVEAAINAARSSLGRPVRVERSYVAETGVPDIPEDLDGVHIYVYPGTSEREPSTRAADEKRWPVFVAIHSRVKPRDTARIDAQIEFAETIEDVVAAVEIDGVELLTIENTPDVFPEHLKAGVFTSVLTATFVGLRERGGA